MRIDYFISDNRIQSKAVLSYKDKTKKLTKASVDSSDQVIRRVAIKTVPIENLDTNYYLLPKM